MLACAGSCVALWIEGDRRAGRSTGNYPPPFFREGRCRSGLTGQTFFAHGDGNMSRTLVKQLLATALTYALVLGTMPLELQAQAPPSGEYSGQGAPLSGDELQQLVAPIALYPDSLVAQILGAATFPDQVSFAANWLKQNSNLTGQTLMYAVDAQQWDPSVKAMTQFPSVLQNLASNLSWTSSLGEAYATQGPAVMSAVQVLRAKAQAAGNLTSGSQIKVVQQSPQVIVIQSANPQVVYVPMYNPAVVYGTPYVTPGYSTAAVVTTAVVAFGVGIAIGAMMNNSCCGWGYSSWNCGWHGSTTVVYHGSGYYGNTAWHGTTTSAYGPYGSAHYSTGYNSATGTYARGGTVSNGYGSASAGQAYNPNTGTYARGATTSNAYGTTSAAQAYNPRTGASASTVQNSNAYGSSGSSTVSKNGNTAYSQHQTTSQGTTGSVQTTNGGKAVGGSGAYNSGAVGETANGNKYATANGNTYKNTGSGWQGSSSNTNQKYNSSSYSSQPKTSSASSGWGGQQKSSGSSAFSSGGGGWQSREASARGSASGGGGGGWGGRR
jgi:Protein of unknown function (DUF3300)